MPVSCAAYGCANRYQSGQNIHFFRFPIHNEEVNKKWVIAVKRKNFTPTQWSRLCSVHFIDSDYQLRPGASKPLLKCNSVPSIFPSFPTYYQKHEINRKDPTKRIHTPVNSTIIDADLAVEDNAKVDNTDGILKVVPTVTVDKEVQTTFNNSKNELELKRKIKILQQKLRRKQKKINNLQDLLKDLEYKGLFDVKPGNIITSCFSG